MIDGIAAQVRVHVLTIFVVVEYMATSNKQITATDVPENKLRGSTDGVERVEYGYLTLSNRHKRQFPELWMGTLWGCVCRGCKNTLHSEMS